VRLLYILLLHISSNVIPVVDVWQKLLKIGWQKTKFANNKKGDVGLGQLQLQFR